MRTTRVSWPVLWTAVSLASLGAACGLAACGIDQRSAPETVASTSSALVATTVYTTGAGLDGGVVTPGDGAAGPTDLHYQLTASTDPAFPAGNLPAPLFVVTPDTATTGQWAPGTSTGEWLSPFVSTRASANAYTYTYRTTFTMPGTIADPTKVVMTGAWACDDSCTLLVNGTQVAADVASGNTHPWGPTTTTFTIPEGSPFVSGANTLDYVVNNSGGYETGLLVTSFVPGCTVDTQCQTATEFCDTQNGPCVPKIVNGQPVPQLTGHTPPLTGTCTGATVGTAVCVSGVCDTVDNACGLANGHGSCTANADGGVVSVCRSGVCDSDGSCGYKNGDGPCTPNDAGSVAVCRSSVCDTDSKCGLANGDGPCTTSNEGTVCRSGVCSPFSQVCIGAAGNCVVDADCSAGDWCNAGTCTPKLTNGTGVPIVAGHMPALTGVCTLAVGEAVCASGVCDTSNSKCGLVDGKPCADGGASVCQSAQCNTGGTCGAIPDAGAPGADAGVDAGTSVDASDAGVDAGCTLDTECAASQWCDTQSGACTPKLGNGTMVPSVTGHTPALTGVCTLAVGAAVCASGVCDTSNSECGLVDGKPCADAGNSVCQSAQCNAGGTCGAAPDAGDAGDAGVDASGTSCTVDTDCASSKWCDTASGACVPKLGNGTSVPTVTGHTPALTGVCTAAVGAAICVSALCDTTNNKCGLVDGTSCVNGGAAICQSNECNMAGKCGANVDAGAASPDAGCVLDSDCAASQWCDTSAGACAPKLTNGTPVPSVTGHAPALTGVCTADVGMAVCASGVCDTSDNSCGYTDGNGPCTPDDASVSASMVCRSGTCNSGGVCGMPTGCQTDADCSANQWCNPSTGVCSMKLPNGAGVPNVPGHVPALTGECTVMTGASVCASGVCDPADNACGLAKGDGPCTVAQGAKVCRSGACLTDFGVCGDSFLPTGGVACSVTRAGTPDGDSPAWPLGAIVVALGASVTRRRRRRA